MSIFNYIFDDEWSQRSDIGAQAILHRIADRQAVREQSRLSLERFSEVVPEDRVTELEREIGELALLTKTLMGILLEEGVCTGKEIEDMMHQVDREDRTTEGGLTKSEGVGAGRCPECNHLIQSQRERCLYCGHEFSRDVGTGTPDAQEGMVELYDDATQRVLGQIPESQLQFLMDHLEENAASGWDYYLDLATLEMLEELGAAEALVQLLRNALGEREGMEVRWQEAQGRAGLLDEGLGLVRSVPREEDEIDADAPVLEAEISHIGAQYQEGADESNPSPRAQSASLDMNAVCEELFSLSVGMNQVFEDQYLGTTITWSGTLLRAARSSFDTVFGSEPCTRAVFETHELAEGAYRARKVQAVVQLPLDILDDVRARVDEEVSFSGTLTSCDTFMRSLFLKDGQLEMDA